MNVLRHLVLLLVAIGLGNEAAHAGEAEDALWRRLAEKDDAGHEAALERWKALTPTERLAHVRAGIRSKDPVVARLASEIADPLALDLSEIRLVMRHCAVNPGWVADPERRLFGDEKANGTAFGTPDMVAIATTAATTPGLELLDEADEFHRALDPSLVPDLAPLLETKNAQVGKRIHGWIRLLADNSLEDSLRPAFARAFLYWRARLAAEKAKEPIPALASIGVQADGPGVPPAVEALVRATLEDGDDARLWGSKPWLDLWVFSLRPEAKDLPLLQNLERNTAEDGLWAWTVRSLAALDPDGSATGWRALAEKGGTSAPAFAAELARRGSPERLRGLLDAEDDAPKLAAVLQWDADPAGAIQRWIRMAATEGVRPSELVDLRPAARARYEWEWGIRIRDEDVAALGKALLEGGTAKRGTAWFFGSVAPEAVTPEIAAVMAQRLAALPEDRYADEHPDAEDLEATLACLEVRAPAVLGQILAGWVAGKTSDGRREALRHLARIGDTRFVESMLASWEEWDLDAHVLGRVKDPRVTAFLKQRAMSEDDDVAANACTALAVSLGLPDEVRWSLRPATRENESFATEPYATARARLLAGDAEGALWAMVGNDVGMLGSLRSEKTLERLRQVRAERLLGDDPAYWRATAELAAAGDGPARTEWQTLLREGRVRMLDDLDVAAVRVLRADPASAVDWIPLLNANCCLGFHAWSSLQEVFPTCPVEKIGPVMTPNRMAFERWYARHRGTFVWSRILDGYVPGPRSR